MEPNNLDRMIALAEEFFGNRSDPTQLSVDEDVMSRLKSIHPATLTERSDQYGPIAWILIIPTLHDLMEQFIAHAINERDLLARTPVGASYESLYLCSALVLPEHRGMGLARGLVLEAVRAIQADHPIRSLFYWSFSPEGDRLALAVARETRLSLFRRR